MRGFTPLLQATACLLLVTACRTAATGSGAIPEPPQSGAQASKSATSVGAAKFDHDAHVDKQKMECPACHHETNAATLKMPHKAYFDDFWIDCKICHKSDKSAPSDPQACSACHHKSPANIADETLSAKVVIHEKCWECHESGKGQAASKGCVTCHPKTQAKTAAPPASAPSKKG